MNINWMFLFFISIVIAAVIVDYQKEANQNAFKIECVKAGKTFKEGECK